MYSCVAPSLPAHDVQHAVEQRDVRAGRDLQVQRGRARRLRAARVDHDQVPRLRRLQPAEQHRMRPRGVAAGDEYAFRRVEVVVARRRRVGAKRLLVAGDRGGHAQPRVGIDVVGADQALGELVEDVVVLGQQLAGDVERDGVGSMLPYGFPEFRAHEIERLIPCGPAVPYFREQAAEGRICFVKRQTLRAKVSAVRGMARIASYGDDFIFFFDLGEDAAADAAVAAGRRHLDPAAPPPPRPVSTRAA